MQRMTYQQGEAEGWTSHSSGQELKRSRMTPDIIFKKDVGYWLRSAVMGGKNSTFRPFLTDVESLSLEDRVVYPSSKQKQRSQLEVVSYMNIRFNPTNWSYVKTCDHLDPSIAKPDKPHLGISSAYRMDIISESQVAINCIL
ncbi:hypothetical protein HGM15179_015285, partial [Zosterops borbonicus]